MATVGTSAGDRFQQFNLDPALVEMVDSVEPDAILEGIIRLEHPDQIPPHFTVISRFDRICTGRFPAAKTWEIRRHPNVVSLKAPHPLGIYESDEFPPDLFMARDVSPPPDGLAGSFTGRRGIVALLDFGLDFTHPNFLNPDGSTRLVAFWHQGAPYDPDHPNRFGYGRIYSREEINGAIRAPDPYQALRYHPAISDTGYGCHGTHTLDIAAGNGRVPGSKPGFACDAEILFVHLSTPRLGGDGHLGNSARLLEAFDYVNETAHGRPWVVNLSVGCTAGSHDGTSPVEQGMHELLRLGLDRAICQSGGNYQDAHLAVDGWLRDGEYHDLEWIVDPRDTTPNELDAWYSGNDRFIVGVRLPGAADFVMVGLGEVADLRHQGNLVGRVYHRKDESNSHDHNPKIYMYSGAPAGTWTVRIIGDYVINGRFHAWIERDLARPGAQSRFDASITSRNYTLGTIATSPLVITVGAYNPHMADRPVAPFSSCGPTRDERDDKPEILAPGVGIVAARSTPRDAVRQEGLLVARSGTSMASPHVAGLVAAMMEAAARPVSIEEIREALRRSADPMSQSDPAHSGAWGRLNPDGAIREIRAMTGAPSEQVAEETHFLDRLERAVAASAGAGRESEAIFLGEVLGGLGETGARAAGSPAKLVRSILSAHGPTGFEVLAASSQQPPPALRAGDVMLRAIPGSGDVGHVSVLASDRLLTHTQIAEQAIPSESSRPGQYGLVIEAGAFPHDRTQPFARRWLDERGCVPAHTVLVRATTLPVEDDPASVVAAPVNAAIAMPSPVVIVKQPHTSPVRHPIKLQTSGPFAGTGAFTRANARVDFYTSASGGKPLTFVGNDNVFTGAQLAAGVQLFAEGVSPSTAMGDVQVTLALQSATDRVGPAATLRLTALAVTLEICQSRTAAGAEPAPMSATNKIGTGRFIHVQDAGHNAGRAMLIVRRARPTTFTGKLVLSTIDARLQVFDAETGPATPVSLPREIDNSAIPADGLRLWVEGKSVSGALRDSGLRLGVKDVEPIADWVAVTVVEFKQIQATIPPTPANTARTGFAAPAPHVFKSTSLSPDFTVNTPLVLMRNAQPDIALEVTSAPAGLPLKWQAIRNPLDHTSLGDNHAVPPLKAEPGDARKAHLDANEKGSFYIRCYIDTSGSNAYLDGAPSIPLTLVLVNATVFADNSVANQAALAPPTASATSVTVKNGTWPIGGLNAAALAAAGMAMELVADVTGGGANGLLGLDSVFVGLINNLQFVDVRAVYHDPAPPGADYNVTNLYVSNWTSAGPATLGGHPLFTPSSTHAPLSMSFPLLDTGRTGEGVGGETATMVSSGPHSSVPRPVGCRWTAQCIDSPSRSFPVNHPVHATAALQHIKYRQEFTANFCFWTNIHKDRGATGHPADRVYSVIRIIPWQIVGEWDVVVHTAPTLPTVTETVHHEIRAPRASRATVDPIGRAQDHAVEVRPPSGIRGPLVFDAGRS